jgi:hypothetical protein
LPAEVLPRVRLTPVGRVGADEELELGGRQAAGADRGGDGGRVEANQDTAAAFLQAERLLSAEILVRAGLLDRGVGGGLEGDGLGDEGS